MTHRIAVINQKGGVGKTTTTVNVAAYLSRLKKTVLVVDADPQGNATSGLGVDKHALKASLHDVMFGEVSLEQAIVQTDTPGVYVLPSNADLANAELHMVDKLRREYLLKQALSTSSHDFVLIDCPPSLGLLTINALTAADSILIPVQGEYYALEGLSQLLGVVQEVRGGLNPELALLGVVLTMFDTRTSLSGQVKEELTKHFGDTLLQTTIPRNIRLAEAPSYGKTIADHDKWSKGARAYKALAKEIVDRV